MNPYRNNSMISPVSTVFSLPRTTAARALFHFAIRIVYRVVIRPVVATYPPSFAATLPALIFAVGIAFVIVVKIYFVFCLIGVHNSLTTFP